ncbi:AAA family ATPase [Burkholderia pseudomultivorans]|uniref:AAA family ATPase n=1 Tax=Burkholderia pseudomultivorans TaxID=1207504 RepID=UPI0009BDA080|nr:AAA family ATPase [Burkholderia pseudomultivorans]
MNTYVYMDNFRGFQDTLVPLSQVNFLVGENSTGKSSFLDLLGALNEFQYWVLDPSLNSIGKKGHHFFDLISAASKDAVSFTVGAVQVDPSGEIKPHGLIATYVNNEWRPEPNRVSLVREGRIITIEGKLWDPEDDPAFKARIEDVNSSPSDGATQVVAHNIVGQHKENHRFESHEVKGEMFRLPFFMRYSDLLYGEKGFRGAESVIPKPFDRNLYEIAPIRSEPRRTYDAPQTVANPEGDHVPYLIKKELASPVSSDNFKKFLRSFGGSSGLFDSLSIKEFGTDPLAPFEMKVDLGEVSLSLQNVGYGVSQALPVLVEVFIRGRGAAFNIQQPEVHLHPRAQAAFGDVVAELARTEDKVFFVETHSDFTIDRFRVNVRKNYAKDVNKAASLDAVGETFETEGDFGQILFFERCERGNRISSIPILKNGDLSEEQPEKYREFFIHESLSLL